MKICKINALFVDFQENKLKKIPLKIKISDHTLKYDI